MTAEWERDPQNWRGGDPPKMNDSGDPCLATLAMLIFCPVFVMARSLMPKGGKKGSASTARAEATRAANRAKAKEANKPDDAAALAAFRAQKAKQDRKGIR